MTRELQAPAPVTVTVLGDAPLVMYRGWSNLDHWPLSMRAAGAGRALLFAVSGWFCCYGQTLEGARQLERVALPNRPRREH